MTVELWERTIEIRIDVVSIALYVAVSKEATLEQDKKDTLHTNYIS